MKMVKNIAAVALATSVMFAGVSFNMSNNYSGLDGGTSVDTSWGASFSLNENTSLGYDSYLGMLFTFDVPMGVSLRFGADGTSMGAEDTAGTSIGLGFTWWTGGEGVKTSISTNYDMIGTGEDADGSLSMVVGFGF